MLHIREEFLEMREALQDLLEAGGDPDPVIVDHLLEELHDLAHSTQTMIDIVVRDYPGADPEVARLAVIEKNRVREYYID